MRFSSRPLAIVTDFEWSAMAIYSCPSFPRGFRHFLNGALSIARRGMHVQIALDIFAAHQVRQAVLLGGFDLTRVFADFRRNEIQLELGVNFFFCAPGDAALALQRGQRVFVQRVAHIVRAAAQRDVVLARIR